MLALKPILMTEGRQDNNAFLKTFLFSSMKSIDCFDFVNIFSMISVWSI